MPTDAATTPPAERTDAAFHALVHRLSEQSVRKHFDAYVDVPWDEYEIDASDPAGSSPTPIRWPAPSGTGRCPSPSGRGSACTPPSPR